MSHNFVRVANVAQSVTTSQRIYLDNAIILEISSELFGSEIASLTVVIHAERHLFFDIALHHNYRTNYEHYNMLVGDYCLKMYMYM